ncbi:MAG: flagellar basal body P-ring formation chaperone FlgA [Planctomycetota bacterium]|jgi:flagella basal body P-ring formation protein FlgA
MSGKKSTKAQRYKNARIFVACVVMTAAVFCRASVNNQTSDSQKDSCLKIYLPREVTVENSNLKLGRISILQGPDSLVAKAGKIALGRISVPGQKIIVDRPMVLSRLACNGIPASKVTLTGSEKITVAQQNRIISSNEFVSLANSFLEKNIPGNSARRWNLIRKPKDFVVSAGSREIRFSPRLVQTGARNQVRIEIALLSGNNKIGVRQVTFSLTYDRQQAVTKVDIPAGGVISPENIKIEKITSNEPGPSDWKPPYGLIAKRRLPANTSIRPGMLEPLKSPIIVKRNQNVLIRIKRPGFLITAAGKTIQDGRAGEYIKVRNMDSQRIIIARISEDGCVEPVL